MAHATILGHSVIHAERYAYSAHPHLAALDDGTWVLVFNRAPRREQVLHPPQEPLFANYVCRSLDEGETWSPPVPVPDYAWTGTECAGLTALPGGRVMLNQWRFDWYPAPMVEAGLAGETTLAPADLAMSLVGSQDIGEWSAELADPERLFPWYRGRGTAWVRFSDDGGLTFPRAIRLDTGPHPGGYGMRGGQVLPDGTVLLALSDTPRNHVTFALRSTDGGEIWSRPVTVAEEPGLDFEEPGGFVTRSGDVVLMLRELTAQALYTVRSSDGGLTWSKPEATGLREYPANPFRLADGRIAVIVGRRLPPFGIRIYLSDDDGARFDWDRPVEVRALPNRDLGYPAAAVRADGTVVAVYYARIDDVTGIHMTRLDIG